MKKSHFRELQASCLSGATFINSVVSNYLKSFGEMNALGADTIVVLISEGDSERYTKNKSRHLYKDGSNVFTFDVKGLLGVSSFSYFSECFLNIAYSAKIIGKRLENYGYALNNVHHTASENIRIYVQKKQKRRYFQQGSWFCFECPSGVL